MMSNSVLSTMPHKRRTKAEVEQFRSDLCALARHYKPVSLRQLYYLAVSYKIAHKTELWYKKVGREMTRARESGQLSWDCIVDYSRHVYRAEQYTGLNDFLTQAQQVYRRNYWVDQEYRIELWCEKETLIGTLEPITDKYGLGLYPCKGFSSITYMHTAAKSIFQSNKRCIILYLGDHDPSGMSIEENVSKKLNQYIDEIRLTYVSRCTPEDYIRNTRASVTVIRLAVNESQIEEYGLPTRFTKKSDSRSKQFRDSRSVDIEAMEPSVIRSICEHAITKFIDWDKWAVIQAAEESELEGLKQLSGQFSD